MPSIRLKFGEDIPNFVRARISYALRVFAAIYNYRVVEAEEGGEVPCFLYSRERPRASDVKYFHIPARYDPNPVRILKEEPRRQRYAGEELYLFYGVDEATGRPDWLGEIFAWISSSHELGITSRDSVGRISYRDMIFSRSGISPRKPYATLLMGWMENSLRNPGGKETLPKPESPIPGVDHIIVCSQDIDFYYGGRISSLIRLIKNLGISVFSSKSWPFFISTLNLLAEALRGNRVGDYLPAMVEKIEKWGFQSTLFVVARSAHRRDPDYRLAEIAPSLSEASMKGFPVEIHGSYTSMIEGETLGTEASLLAKATGASPRGNRQHWLRFGQHEKLFQAVERANLLFDSTLGFSEMIGFRNGASFAFPPYDFNNEKPYRFLEIPLVLMDVGLEAASRTLGKHALELAEEVLEESRKWSWGGISLLWHNPIEPLHVANEVNQVFWDCAAKRGASRERWMSTTEFVGQCLKRYQDAGLMDGVQTTFQAKVA